MSSNSGTLWIVATPLGNPGDLSPRAREVLGSVRAVLAEDTRRAGLLFARCGIEAASFVSFHDHNENERLSAVLARLRQGDSLALISDAGTPLLSDPGYTLVRACREAGIPVSPVPGPFAPAAALSACGLPPQPFAFLGFAPRKKGELDAFFAPYASLALSLVFFERKDRLRKSLAAAHAVLGERRACIARELTKTHEEFIAFALAEHTGLPAGLRGEITVLIGPPEAGDRASRETVLAMIAEERTAGGGARDMARRVRERAKGWSGKDIYALLRNGKDGENA